MIMFAYCDSLVDRRLRNLCAVVCDRSHTRYNPNTTVFCWNTELSVPILFLGIYTTSYDRTRQCVYGIGDC